MKLKQDCHFNFTEILGLSSPIAEVGLPEMEIVFVKYSTQTQTHTRTHRHRQQHTQTQTHTHTHTHTHTNLRGKGFDIRTSRCL